MDGMIAKVELETVVTKSISSDVLTSHEKQKLGSGVQVTIKKRLKTLQEKLQWTGEWKNIKTYL